eukprot:361016-Chlamydomonas_euryale.AAC.1
MGSWPLSRHVDRSRLRYLGHICRMPDGSLAKHMLFATQLAGVPLLHPRPKRRWIDCVKATLLASRFLSATAEATISDGDANGCQRRRRRGAAAAEAAEAEAAAAPVAAAAAAATVGATTTAAAVPRARAAEIAARAGAAAASAAAVEYPCGGTVVLFGTASR